MEMKSRAVKLFCAIAESGSLLAASNKLNLSSSAASRMLSQLEDRLGVKLFERGNKQLVLSEEGSNFYRVAHEAMKAWKVLEDYSAHPESKKTFASDCGNGQALQRRDSPRDHQGTQTS